MFLTARRFRCLHLCPRTRSGFLGIRLLHELLQAAAEIACGHEMAQRPVDAVIRQEGDTALAVRAEVPACKRVIVMEGLGQAARDIVGILDCIVVVIARPVRREEFLPVNIDSLAILDRHMTAAVIRHHLRQALLAQLRLRVIGERLLPLRLFVEVLVFEHIARLIRQVIGHAVHGRRRAARVEAGARHDVEAACISLVLRRQRDVLGDGVIGQRIELVPVHESGVHVEEAHAVVLRDSLGVILGAVLLDAMRHLVGEDGGELIFIALEAAHERPVDADVVCREAGCIEIVAVVDAPDERQRVDLQHVVALVDELLHDPVDNLDIVVVVVLPVLTQVLTRALHLRADIIAEREDTRKARLVGRKDAERLRGNGPGINSLRPPRRQGD